MSMKYSVAIIDDDANFRESAAWLLKSIDIQTESFHDVEDFLAAYQAGVWSCLIIDIRMPKISGLQLQERLIEINNKIPIIIISGHADIPIAVKAMKNGAYDFLTKPFHDQTFLDAVNQAIEYKNNKLPCDNKIDVERRLSNLTERERQVLDCILQGGINKQIAAKLHISIKTVELHRSRVMQKMQAHTPAELVKLYLAAKN